MLAWLLACLHKLQAPHKSYLIGAEQAFGCVGSRYVLPIVSHHFFWRHVSLAAEQPFGDMHGLMFASLSQGDPTETETRSSTVGSTVIKTATPETQFQWVNV